MRKYLVFSFLFLSLFGCCQLASAQETPVTLIESVYLYRAPDETSDVLGELPEGTQVGLREMDDGWATVVYKFKTGFVRKSALSGSAALDLRAGVTLVGRTMYVCEETQGTTAAGQPIDLAQGQAVTFVRYADKTAYIRVAGRSVSLPLRLLSPDEECCYAFLAMGDSIRPLQERLEALGYFDGRPSGLFDPETAMALIRFRVQLDLADEFRMDDQTYEWIYEIDAPKCAICGLRLSLSDTGNAVERLQNRLAALGYLQTEVRGYYDMLTLQAVMLYQQTEGLKATGDADPATLSRLFSGAAKALPKGATAVSVGTTEQVPGIVRNLDWFTGGIQEIYTVDTVAKYVDIQTGITWYEIRRGGYNHADTQPLTAADTARFLLAVGGEWTWDRRPVWVVIDGVRYAASINCMPHGQGSVQGNNFNGHHCTHFLNSRTHGTDSWDPAHQAAVQVAAHTKTVTLQYELPGNVAT